MGSRKKTIYIHQVKISNIAEWNEMNQTAMFFMCFVIIYPYLYPNGTREPPSGQVTNGASIAKPKDEMLAVGPLERCNKGSLEIWPLAGEPTTPRMYPPLLKED